MTEIEHPVYYSSGGIEAIDFIEAHGLNFNLGNVVKYITRAGRKDGEDRVTALNKALWYLIRERDRLQKGESKMTNALQVFNYNNKNVRTTIINGEPWFVAKDICDILELSNPTEALKALDDDEKNTLRISEGIPERGNPNMNIISESGLYSLIFRSNKPEAKAFSRWVRHEVLPSIRKTGCYSMHDAQNLDAIKPYMSRARFNATERIIKAAFNCKKEKDFQAVLAMNRAFQARYGYSPLDDAGLRLVKVLDDVSLMDADWQWYVDDNGELKAWADIESLPHHFEWKHDLPALKLKKED